MDIIICLPKTVSWIQYKLELRAVESKNMVLYYHVARKPKNVNPGDKCYLVHNGILKGWMEITGVVSQDAFKCTTTGKEWPEGWYIQRSGKFHPVSPKKIGSFRGYRYWFPEVQAY